MPATYETRNGNGRWISPYLLNEPRILREVCRTMRRDDGGRHCPECGLRDFCETQARGAGWLLPE